VEWFVQYTSDGADYLERTETPEAALELACRLLDSGADVVGIGMEESPVSIGRRDCPDLSDLDQSYGGAPPR
jgi:hypothetical protein